MINFRHKQAAHCENGVTANLLNYYGIELSEPMVFGIGSGCFFSYMPFYKLNSLPVISFRHWPGIIFKRVTARLNIQTERKKYSNRAKAMSELDELLFQKYPVGMLVGVFNLSYFPPEYRFHFNAHNLIVIGKENGEYLISDPVMERLEKLNHADLEKVRFAYGTYPPKGRIYYIKQKPENLDLESAIKKGIKQNCSDMLTIPVPLFGVKGIKYIAKKVKKWPDKFGDKKAATYLGQFIRMLEEIGTGGAGFRFMYAAFLQESAGILNLDDFRGLSKEMTEVGDKWREFAFMGAKNLRNRGAHTPYADLSEMLNRIAIREEKIFTDLQKIISK